MARCAAYIERGGEPVTGGGRRHRRCKRDATEMRSREEGHWSGPVTRTYDLCGQHAAQWDKAEACRTGHFSLPFANPLNLSSDF